MSVLLSFFLLLSPLAEAKIVTRVVEYKHKDVVLEGYLAFDDAKKGVRPGVLVIHEWTGVGPHVQKVAQKLARLGYVAFAPDIYGKGIRPQPPQAAEISSVYKNDRTLLRERVAAGLEELKKQKTVDTRKLAAIGYCFGGTSALELARMGADVSAFVSFHGSLTSPTPGDAKNIKGKVLVLHGADDPYVPDDEVKGFENEMRAAKVDWQLVKYSGAVHSFTNVEAGNDNSKGAAYNQSADQRSWGAMKAFLRETIGG